MSKTQSKKAAIRWAKYRLEKGKPKEGDIELLKSEGIYVEETPQNSVEETPQREFKSVENSENYFDNNLDSFVSQAVENEKDDVTIDDFTYNFDDEYDDNPETYQKTNLTEREKFKVKGRMLLFFIDLVAPTLLVFIAKKFLKKDVKASDLKLDNEEKEELEPVADEVVLLLGMDDLNPVTELTLALILTYGSKIYFS